MQRLETSQPIATRGRDWLYTKTRRWHKAWWWRAETAMLAMAVVLGMLSAGLQQVHERARLAAVEAAYQTRIMLVANADLKAGTIITNAQLTTAAMLDSTLSKNMLTAKQQDLVIGRRLNIDLKQGDPLLLTAVQGFADPATIAGKIPPGQRFFTLSVNDQAANNGFLKPNDHVDIFAHIELPGRGLTTFNLLQDVTLISVGKATVEAGGVETAATSVSFFVDAAAAPLMAFAQHRGEFAVSLRNPQDLQQREQDSRGIDMADFLDHRLVAKASGGGDLKVTVGKPSNANPKLGEHE